VQSQHGTSQPTVQIFKRIFGDCILQVQGAIDFAELRSEGVAGFAPSLTFSSGRIAAHMHLFLQVHSARCN